MRKNIFLNNPSSLSDKERIDKIINNTMNNLVIFRDSLDIEDNYNQEFISKLENNIVNISNNIIDSMDLLKLFSVYDISDSKEYSFLTRPKGIGKEKAIKHTLSPSKVELYGKGYYQYLQRFMQNPININTRNSSSLMLKVCIKNFSYELNKQISKEILKNLLHQKECEFLSKDSLRNYAIISEFKTESKNLMILSQLTFDKLDFDIHNELVSKFNYIINESIPKGEIIFIEDPLNTVALGISDIFGIEPKSYKVFSTFDIGLTNLEDFKRIKIILD